MIWLNTLMVVYDQGTYCSFFPMGLAYLASAIRTAHPDVKIEVWQQDIYHYEDEELTGKLNTGCYDVVMISVIGGLYQYRKLLSLAKAVNASTHRKKLKFLIGGHGPSAAPEYFLRKTGADICGIGEGESTLQELFDSFKGNRELADVKGIAYIENGRFCQTASRELIEDVNSIAWPAWDLFDMNYYAMYRFPNILPTERSAVMLTGRGCTFSCNFCYRMDRGFRPRSPESVIGEMQHLMKHYRIRYFYFADELLMNSRERVTEFCRALLDAELDVHWWCNGRLNYADRDILELMKRAGCVCINYGIESLDNETRRIMKKGLTEDMIMNGVRNTLDVGITPALNIIYGNLGEPIEALARGSQFMIEHNDHKDSHSIHFVVPYPGTELFEEAVRRGLIRDVEDFYEGKHTSYDLLTTNFTGHNRLDIYTKFYEANRRIVEDHYLQMGKRHMEKRYRILRKEIEVLQEKRQQITDRVIPIVQEAMPIRADVQWDSCLKDDLGIDSMMMFRILVDCEDGFGIRFEPDVDDLNQIFTTVGSLILAIERKIEGVSSV